MERVLEGVASVDPFVVRRRVKWGECDPARVVYTPQFAHYAIEAILTFNREIIGKQAWRDVNGGPYGLPMKALELEFEHFLVVDDEVDISVHVGELRRRTFDLHFAGTCRGRRSFHGKGAPIVTHMMDHLAVELPAELRTTLQAYAARNPRPL